MANGYLGLDNEALVEDQFGTSATGSDTEITAEQQETSGDGLPFDEQVDVVDVQPIPVEVLDGGGQGSDTVDPSPDQEAEEQVQEPEPDSSGPLALVTDNPMVAGALALGGIFLLGR